MWLKSMGAALVPAATVFALSVAFGFFLMEFTPPRLGEMILFVFPGSLLCGAVLSLIVYIISCIIFMGEEIPSSVFWWVTLASNVAALLLFCGFFFLVWPKQ